MARCSYVEYDNPCIECDLLECPYPERRKIIKDVYNEEGVD